jgi:uncharacterized repeat protein (TIGR03803 family)
MKPRALMLFAVSLLSAATTIAAPAQTFETLASFNEKSGASEEYMSLVQGPDGNFYGANAAGGINGDGGAIFKITPGGKKLMIYSFCAQPNCADGSFPVAGLVLGNDLDFYGTTSGGGVNGKGTVFKITSDGTLTTLYSFCDQPGCEDGSFPAAALVQADGDFYGTTGLGGNTNEGTVFKITSGGALTTLYSFCSLSGCPDGNAPHGALVLADNGSFYGITSGGGNGPFDGTVFEISPTGALSTLYSFCTQTNCTDGEYPFGGLIQATDGNFYGTTSMGGANGYGTVFKITPERTLTTLYSFCVLSGCSENGDFPDAGLAQATDGNFYGTTSAGGNTDVAGTLFKITPDGTLTTLYGFCAQTKCADGSSPFGGLMQSTNGNFYGATALGGTYGEGTVFSLSTGLGPFVSLQQHSGKVGQTIGILGQGFTGATGVSFNGTPATFKVLSETYLTAVVPGGATSGFLTATTPGGTLTSNKEFRVKPQQETPNNEAASRGAAFPASAFR